MHLFPQKQRIIHFSVARREAEGHRNLQILQELPADHILRTGKGPASGESVVIRRPEVRRGIRKLRKYNPLSLLKNAQVL